MRTKRNAKVNAASSQPEPERALSQPERVTRASQSNAKVRTLSLIVHINKMTFECGRVAAVARGPAHRPDVVEDHSSRPHHLHRNCRGQR